MKKIVAIIISLFILSGFTVMGETPDNQYSQNYGTFIGNGIENLLDNDTKEKLEEGGISPDSADWVNSLSAQNVFAFLWSLVKGDIKKPFIAAVSIISTLLILSVVSSFGDKKSEPAVSVTATAVIALIVGADICACVSAAENGIKLCAEFMIGFVPIFAAVVAASGRALTAVSSSTVLMLAANAVSYFAAFGVLPLMGGYLSISIAGGISPLVSELDFAGTVKKITLWGLSFISTVFIGVISVQTAVNSAADTVSMKTAKFILGTSVPVAGTVLSEAAATVSTSLSFLKSSVGIYAVIVIAVIMLPVITDILLWRGCFALGSIIGNFLGQKKIPVLLKSVDSVLACLLGVILLVAALFIISLTVLISAGKGV